MLKEAAQTVASQNIVNGSFVNVQAFKFVKAIEIAGVTGAVSFDHELGVAAPACAALLGSACCEQREDIVKVADIHPAAAASLGKPAVKQPLLEAGKLPCAEAVFRLFAAERVKAVYRLHVSEVILDIEVKQLICVRARSDDGENVEVPPVLSQQ